MTDAKGTVVEVDGDYAMVRIEAATGCGRCHEPGGCGATNLGQMFCATPKTFRVRNSGRRAVGDEVTIAIASGAVRRSALLAYGMPLGALFAGAIAGSVAAGDVGAICGAVAGLVVAWLALRAIGARSRPDPRFEAFIRN
jgi:sigma-E factor negative regulatory protein RseC